MREKIIIGGYFAIAFIVLMLFFGYMYPIVPFWGDDWQFLSNYGSLKVYPHSWIPARLLPPILHTSIGIFAAYIIAPLSGLDFIDSISIACAIYASFALLILLFLVYKLSFYIIKSKASALLISSFFLLGAFAMMKPHFMPPILSADLNAEGMGYLLTILCFYILPNLLNIGLIVCILIAIHSKANIFLNTPKRLVLIGGGR